MLCYHNHMHTSVYCGYNSYSICVFKAFWLILYIKRFEWFYIFKAFGEMLYSRNLTDAIFKEFDNCYIIAYIQGIRQMPYRDAIFKVWQMLFADAIFKTCDKCYIYMSKTSSQMLYSMNPDTTNASTDKFCCQNECWVNYPNSLILVRWTCRWLYCLHSSISM